jgi:fructosamine-3-kinase
LSLETLDASTRYLLSDGLRLPLEQQVSAYLGRAWQVRQVWSRADAASHPAAILADDTDAVFAKLGQGDQAQDQFEREVAGLRLLTERAGVLTPQPIGLIPVENEVLFIMEAVQVIAREPLHWRQIGQALARIHAVKGERYGLESHCYWGDLYQDNRPLPDWPAFFRERRIAPRLQAAVDSGNLPLELLPPVEGLMARLPELCGPLGEPTLLHGDAHQNNFLTTGRGPVLIDPSVYYGHPEIDLAYVDIFAPVPEALFQGYQELTPLAPGFAGRRELWRIPFRLAMVQVDGPQHVADLTAALRLYL